MLVVYNSRFLSVFLNNYFVLPHKLDYTRPEPLLGLLEGRIGGQALVQLRELFPTNIIRWLSILTFRNTTKYTYIKDHTWYDIFILSFNITR